AACGSAPAATPASSAAVSPSASALAKPAGSAASPVSSASAKPAASASSAASAAAKPAGSAAASPAASGLTKLRFRYPVQTGAWIPFMIAKDQNVFQKYGLDVDVQLLQSTLMVPAIINGEMDVAGTSAETVIASYAKGIPLNIIGSMIPETVGYLVVSPDIKTVEDLKGQVVVLTGFGNVAEFALRRILAMHNLEFGKDVQVRGVGNQ